MDEVLRDFPYSFETERLTIRGPLPGDGANMREAVLESREELEPWLPWAVKVMSADEYEAYVRRAQLRFLAREDLWLILFLKGTNVIVGGSGLHRIDWSVPKFEIGYWVRTRYAGQGFITEAAAGISEFAFSTLGARRVEIHCDAENARSASVARRLGFVHEGTFHNYIRHHITNELRDLLVFAKLAEQGE
jgi:RimJ/RimL family protein N-acetyltransferase